MTGRPPEKKKFKLILKENYDMELTDDEAILINKNLINFIKILYQIYSRNHNEMQHIIKLKKQKDYSIEDNKKNLNGHHKSK